MPTSGKLGTADSMFGDLLIGGSAFGSVTIDVGNTFAPLAGVASISQLSLNPMNQFVWQNVGTQNYVQLSIANNFAPLFNIVGTDWTETIIQYLNFTPRHIAAVGNNFIWSDKAAEVTVRAATNNFSPLLGAVAQWYTAVNEFVFAEVATASQVLNIENIYVLADTVASVGTTSRDETQKILKQHLTYSISGAQCIEKEYRPAIGESGDTSYTAMPVTPPTFADATLTLTYPYVSPTSTLVLKNPELGNSDSLTFTVIDRETRGGDRIVYSDSKWAKAEVHAIELVNVCSPTFDNLLAFLNASLGKEIGFLDWENRQWRGIILAPNTVIQRTRDGYNVRLQFQGVLA